VLLGTVSTRPGWPLSIFAAAVGLAVMKFVVWKVRRRPPPDSSPSLQNNPPDQ
jgi:hypothetical protein